MRKIANTNAARRGFTLIELLVVIAISSILFFLLLRPLNDAFKLTQRAQVLAAAQDSARKSLEQITREVGSAVYVFDGQSHPFGGKPVAGQPTDKYSNFLNVDMTDKTGNNVTAHLYNSKLMLVPARRGDEGGLVDPTTGEPIKLDSGSGSATLDSNNLTFPGAPANSIVVYFVGLKTPVDYTAPPPAYGPGRYTNSNEGLVSAATTDDNTYILWRAQVPPYLIDPKTKKVSANKTYFPRVGEFDGGTIQEKVELDDPDMFRYVTATDVNWLAADHHLYTTDEVTNHNNRTQAWAKIAKAIITAPDADLLLVPHNADNTVKYDDATGAIPGVAHFGVTHDPLNDNGGVGYPIVTSSVSFRPATQSNDAAAASNSDYSSLGIPANAADNAGLPYIPTQFSTASQSWSNGYQITLYPVIGNPATFDQVNTPYFYTRVSTSAGGDVIEYRHEAGKTAADPTVDTPVYDVTLSQRLVSDGRYVPLIFAQDTGLVRFNLPYLPVPGNNYQRYTAIPVVTQSGTGELNNNTFQTGVNPGQIDLTQLPNSPLPQYGVQPTGLKVATAVVVPGSVKVYGPDANAGPGVGNSVLYSPVSPSTPLGANQYRVDYRQGIVQLNIVYDPNNQALNAGLPTVKNDGTAADPVQIAFEYQANLAPTVNSPLQAKVTDYTVTAISSDNAAAPMLVKVDYQTRDLLDIGIGVRIYDTSGGAAQIVNVNNRVKVNNSNR